MSNKFDEMRSALQEARDTLAAADKAAADMGSMLVGRLRHCRSYDVALLKRELRAFNIHTGTWRKK